MSAACGGDLPWTCTVGSNQIVYRESWESCTLPWTDVTGKAATAVTDYSSARTCAGAGVNAMIFEGTAPLESSWLGTIPLTAGESYCVSVWFKWAGGAQPWLSMRRFGPDFPGGSDVARLIGQPAAITSDPLFGDILALDPWSAWVNYRKTVTIPAGTERIQFVVGRDADVVRNGADDARLDDVLIAQGACP